MNTSELTEITTADDVPRPWMRALLWLPLIYLMGTVLIIGLWFFKVAYSNWNIEIDQLVLQVEHAAEAKDLPRLKELNDQLETRVGRLASIRDILFCLMPLVLALVPLYLWVTWQITHRPAAPLEVWARWCTLLVLGATIAQLLGSSGWFVELVHLLTTLVVQAGQFEALSKVCRLSGQRDLLYGFQRSERLLGQLPLLLMLAVVLIVWIPGGNVAAPYLKPAALGFLGAVLLDNARSIFILRHRLTRMDFGTGGFTDWVAGA